MLDKVCPAVWTRPRAVQSNPLKRNKTRAEFVDNTKAVRPMEELVQGPVKQRFVHGISKVSAIKFPRDSTGRKPLEMNAAPVSVTVNGVFEIELSHVIAEFREMPVREVNAVDFENLSRVKNRRDSPLSEIPMTREICERFKGRRNFDHSLFTAHAMVSANLPPLGARGRLANERPKKIGVMSCEFLFVPWC